MQNNALWKGQKCLVSPQVWQFWGEKNCFSNDLQLQEMKKRMWRASLARPLWNPIKMHHKTLSQLGHCHLEAGSSFPASQYPRLLHCFPIHWCKAKTTGRTNKAAHTREKRASVNRLQGSMFFTKKKGWLRRPVKFRRRQDVRGPAASEAEADSNWHLVAQRASHSCLCGFKVGLIFKPIQ